MPCFENIQEKEQWERDRTQQNLEKIAYLEACLCALTSELLLVKGGTALIEKAEENGKVDIKKFIQEHKISDARRLSKILEGLSVHEIDLLKTILNPKK